MNFLKDIADYCKEQLKANGVKISSEDIRSIIGAYINYNHRRVKTRPRQLHFSQELESSIPDKCRSGFDLLCKKIKAGVSLQEHQSKMIDKNRNDKILNDWFIHHFHLGEKLKSNGFIERTESLLMAMVFDDDFYAIKVYHHNDFSRQEIIHIAHRNWPIMFKKKFDTYNSGIKSPPYTDECIKKLRGMNINYQVVMEDGSDFCLGGGSMMNGINTKIDIQVIVINKTCQKLTELVLKYKENWITEAKNKYENFPSSPEFFLAHNGSTFKLAEKLSGTGFNISTIDGELEKIYRLLKEIK